MEIATELIKQLPSAVAILIVVIYFIRYVQRRDEQEQARASKTLEVLTALAVTVNTVCVKQDDNHRFMVSELGNLRTESRRRKKVEVRTNE